MTNLAALAEEIRLLEDEARGSQRRPIEIQIAIGEHLLTAKSLLKHGDFVAWLDVECHYGRAHAYNLMYVASNFQRAGNLSPSISLRGAIAAITKALRIHEVDLGDWTDEEQALRLKLEEGIAVVVNFDSHQRLIAWAKATDRFERIDRGSVWGNPYLLDKDGDRATVIANYRDHYLDYKPSLLMRIGDLEGKALACWCAPEPCHGDVLLEQLEGLLIQESMPSHAGILRDLVNDGHR